MYAITARADDMDDEDIVVHTYDVSMVLDKERNIKVKEKITVEFNDYGLSMFYRSLPKEGAIYSDISASCEGNDAFHFEVADNPDYDELLDINCIGNANKGQVWTYDISYTMQGNTGDTGDRMIIDVIGFGWPVALHDVTVKFSFPAALEEYKVYVGFQSTHADESKVVKTLSEDGKELTMYASKLSVVDVYEYDEEMAEGITLDFRLPKGTLKSYFKTRFFTKDMWKIALVGGVVLAAAVVVFLTMRKRKEIITVVNVKAPDDMDPMRMGKWLDGVVDTEDVTSMIYYFAYKGYLLINMQDEHDPVLIRRVQNLPDDAPVYEKTLFKGLFGREDSVAVSKLAGRFYEYMERAKAQMPSPKMYDKKSLLGFFLGGIIGIVYAFFVPLFKSLFNVGGGYAYMFGVLTIIPIALVWFIAYISENYRYKWKRSARVVAYLSQWVIMAVALLIFRFAFAQHFMTEYETLILCGVTFVATMVTLPCLSRREKYVEELGQILGFKDFIVCTEEDKIKFMLEENPELFYKVLPYAQVLGVTDAWEDKFKNIVLEPPTYYVGADASFFDYLIFRQCMISAMRTAVQPPVNETKVGRSGFGGGFGGFGGGGFGGGGGGAR